MVMCSPVASLRTAGFPAEAGRHGLAEVAETGLQPTSEEFVGDGQELGGDFRLHPGDFDALLVLRNAWNIEAELWNHTQDPCGVPGWSGILCNQVDNQTRVVSIADPYSSSGIGLPLVGTLPPEVGNLSALQGISLDNSELTGKLPCTLQNLQQLKVIRLSNAFMTGPIPAELTLCQNLRELHLAGNQFSGPISPSFAPPQLTILEIQDNYITGLLPETLTGLLKYPAVVSCSASPLLVKSAACLFASFCMSCWHVPCCVESAL
jgi:hypothetical protein